MIQIEFFSKKQHAIVNRADRKIMPAWFSAKVKLDGAFQCVEVDKLQSWSTLMIAWMSVAGGGAISTICSKHGNRNKVLIVPNVP